MKITVLGPAHPYRGGLASIMETMARVFTKRGCEVDIKTFTLQYPSFLFPGESQTLSTPPPNDLKIERCLNSMNPFNWIALGLRIRRERPDFILMKYWTPFLAPCFATVARIAKTNGHTKVICQVDNVEPHEHRIIDKPCNYYYLRAVDGFIYMSEQVNTELKEYTSALSIFSPHPLFGNFGERVGFEHACDEIGLDPNFRYALFFGLIRDYKGLDTLLDAWTELKSRGVAKGKKLIVAGEFYTSKDKYLEQIKRGGLEDDIILRDYFIDDKDVKYYFSASDFVVQPYKTATQSGVTQIAYQFYLPMIVTDVGGLSEIVPNDVVGYVCNSDSSSVAEAVEKMWHGDNIERFRVNIEQERKRFSWEEMCNRITELYERIK